MPWSQAKASACPRIVNKNASILVAGARGLAGSAVVRRLRSLGFNNLLTPASADVDLRQQAAVDSYLERTRPEAVILAAARVGGIHANNTRPADFIRDNLQIQTNVIDASHRVGVKKFMFLGSSCIYPRLAEQPMRESALLTGPLEPTNQWYAIAKIAGLKMCQAYRRQYGFDAISVMPTNLYGPGDNFSELDSHVLPALIRRFHEAASNGAPEVVMWGSGTPRREFLHADDFADAACLLLEKYSAEEPINIGCGTDVSISELATLVAAATGFRGRIVNDTSRPDGAPRKLLDVSRLTALGWRPNIPLAEGIASTAKWYRANYDTARR
jgi:GDP-L-fucose synthase